MLFEPHNKNKDKKKKISLQKKKKIMPRGPSPKKEPSKTITADDLEKMTERLTRVPKPPKAGDDHLLAQKKTITDEDLQKQITRLYDQSIETKKRKMEKAAKNEEKDVPPSKRLSEEELAESVARQYNQALDHKRIAQERLKKKFLFHAPEGSLTPRTKTEVKTMGSRLHDESISKKKESMDKLYAKYVYSTGPQPKFITPEEAQEAADRLCQPKDGFAGVPIPMNQSTRTPRKKVTS